MSITTQSIYAELSAAEAVTAAMAEGTIDLPQGMACQRVISCDGRVTQLAAEAVKGALALEGLVEFAVVFEDGQGELGSVTGVCPFTHRLNAPQAEPGMDVAARGGISSPSARTAGSGRLVVEAVVEISAEAAGVQSLQVVSGAEDRLQTQTQKIFWQKKKAGGKSSVTVREDVELPSNLPEVNKVLLSRADVRVSEARALGGEAVVSGDLLLSVLYADAANNLNRASFVVPYGASVSAAGISEGMDVRAWGSASQLFINVGENLSDERRVLSLEAPLFLNVEGYEPCEVEAVKDAYHLDYDIGMTREDIGLLDGPVELSEKVKVRGALPRTDVLDEDSTLQAAEVTPVIDSYTVTDGSVALSGRLVTRAFYRAATGELDSTLVDAPFDTGFMWEGASAGSKVELKAVLLDSDVSAAGEFAVEADLEVGITSRRVLDYTVVTALEQGAPLGSLAPLTLCIAGKDDDAWTLARRCRVKVEDLIRTNPEIAGGVQPGAKIVILRK